MSYPAVPLTSDRNGKRVTVDRFPDHCPQCRNVGKQSFFSGLPTETKADSVEPSLWIPMVCPVDRCARPYFAVYQRPSPAAPYAPDYAYWYSTPSKPPTHVRDEIIEEISEDYYSILDQALAAETHRLDLIAGMGYRKALEYLVKDYVTINCRNAYREAKAANDEAALAKALSEYEAILAQPLGKIIKLIPHELTKQVADRCAWLGNDETHYSRKWSAHDVEDLKELLGIVASFLSNDERARRYVEKMPRPD